MWPIDVFGQTIFAQGSGESSEYNYGVLTDSTGFTLGAVRQYINNGTGYGGLNNAHLNAFTADTVLNWQLGPDEGNGIWLIRANAVPEPSVLALIGLSFVGLGFARRRRQ